MNRNGVIFSVWRDSMRRNLLSVPFLLAFLLLPILMNLISKSTVEYAESTGQSFNVIESFLAANNHIMIAILQLAIITVLFCDAPFFTRGQMEIIIRTGRRQWFLGKLAYIATVCLLFELWAFLSTCITCMQHGYIGNVWSTMMYGAAVSDSTAYLHLSPQLMRSMSPYAALWSTIALNTLLYLLSATVLFGINMRFKRIYGYGAVLLLVMLSLLAYFGAIPLLASPLHATMLSYYGFGTDPSRFQTPMLSAIYLGLPLLVTCALTQRALNNTSFTYGE